MTVNPAVLPLGQLDSGRPRHGAFNAKYGTRVHWALTTATFVLNGLCVLAGEAAFYRCKVDFGF